MAEDRANPEKALIEEAIRLAAAAVEESSRFESARAPLLSARSR